MAAVLRGQAGPGLLDTYTVERAPVAARIVKRANQSPRDWGVFLAALGLTDARDSDDMIEQIARRKENSPEGERPRAALVDAMALKNYKFNTNPTDTRQYRTVGRRGGKGGSSMCG